jgi:hypothetical protein
MLLSLLNLNIYCIVQDIIDFCEGYEESLPVFSQWLPVITKTVEFNYKNNYSDLAYQ